jgi:WD40 repeat protein
MRRSKALCISSLLVLAAVSGAGHVRSQDVAASLPVPTAVTPTFPEEGLLYGDKGLTQQELRETWGPPTKICCIAYSPNGKTLAVGDGPTRGLCTTWGPGPANENGGLVRLVDTVSNGVVMTIRPTKVPQHEYEIRRLTFSAVGKVLIAEGREDYEVRRQLVYVSSFTAWDPSNGRVLYRIAGTTNDRWTRTAIAANTGILAAATEGAVFIWDGSADHKRHALGDIRSRPTMLMFSPDGRTLACGLEDGTVTVWDAVTVRRAAWFPGHDRHGRRYAINLLAFSPDGKDLAAAATFRDDVGARYRDYSEVRILSVSGRKERATLPGRDDEVFKCIAFSPDCKTLATGGSTGWGTATADNGQLRLWDAATGVERGSFTTHRQWVIGLSFSPDGRILAAADRGSIVLRYAKDEAQRIVLACDTQFPEFHEPVFSPDGKTLASVDGAVKLWNIAFIPRTRTNR